jgi:hypothetical protein
MKRKVLSKGIVNIVSPARNANPTAIKHNQLPMRRETTTYKTVVKMGIIQKTKPN